MIRRAFILLAAVAAAGSLQTATAMNYQSTNSDMLLIFRKAGSKDVEFDIGNVTNYLGLAAGTTVTVNNYSTNQVYTNYNSSLNGVLFIVAACNAAADPAPCFWITDADLVDVPNQLTVNSFSTVSGKLTSVGGRASSSTGHNPLTAWVDTPSDQNSYSYIVSENNIDPTDISTWFGNFDFAVETTSGNTLDFYQLKLNPSAPPGKLIGSFTLAGNGVLTFSTPQVTVTPTRPAITQMIWSNGVSSISFSTTNTQHYILRYSANPVAPLATWPTNVAAGTITGDNTVHTFTDTTANTQRFYLIQSY